MTTKLEDMELQVTMPDGSVWAVPVLLIALNRAEEFKSEFDGDAHASLHGDTRPLFEEHHDEVIDWAGNNMNWSDVRRYSTQVAAPSKVDFQEGWLNGRKAVVEVPS